MRFVRLMLASLALSLAAAPANATDVGVIAGFNIASLSIEDVSGMDTRSDFVIGLAVDRALTERWGIRVEPTFMEKGGKATRRNPYWGSNDGALFELACIDVPILARWDLASSPTRGYLLGGFGFSFATDYNVEISLGDYTEDVDFGDVLESTDVSFDLGAGVSFPAGTNRITVDGRAAIGLIDINKGGTVTFNGGPLTVPQVPTHTLDFRLFASYLFAWGGN